MEALLLASRRVRQPGVVQLAPASFPLAAGVVASDLFSASAAEAVTLSVLNGSVRMVNSLGQIPPSLIPGNIDDFVISAEVNLTGTGVYVLLGNLVDGAGSGSFWLSLNNTYQVASQISLDGYDANGAVQRFRFGSGKLPTGAWTTLKLQRVSGVLSFYLNGVQVGASQSMPNGFRNNAMLNPLMIGSSADNAYKLAGQVRNLIYTVGK